jgi:1-deoxy-D-xylulose-5-phosphate synthase
MRFIKPLDRDLILELTKSHELLVTVEENVIMGGAGSGVNELLQSENAPISVLNLGLPDQHIEHGPSTEILASYGLDAAGIRRAILRRCPLEVAANLSTA